MTKTQTFPAKTNIPAPRSIVSALFTLGLLVQTGAASGAWADQGGFSGAKQAAGGFTGPGPALTTVEQAQGLRDDVPVSLRGNVVQHLGGDTYLFRDGSGTIRVDIDDDVWNGQNVGPADTVKIDGTMDKDWNSVEIDVKRLIKQ
ncbi:YgiW/YdeI family stress tolerance OB fold protein [Desulfobulbus elongatus]|uniref:YgiW/YdeI family stress tolerance OB fold protein n=1 Tax=Desulfobulbus elongatus TaxID=53332 RepID=UPI000A015CB7|nr:YgiW/YdeI family stress tolerance OB fold protein [Desulfobulbus elongatus]